MSNIHKQAISALDRQLCKRSLHLMVGNEFLLEAGMSSRNKQERVASYLIGKTLESTYKVNVYVFNRKQLSNKFNCSMMTVNRAIKALKNHDKYVTIKGNIIRLNVKSQRGGSRE